MGGTGSIGGGGSCRVEVKVHKGQGQSKRNVSDWNCIDDSKGDDFDVTVTFPDGKSQSYHVTKDNPLKFTWD